MPSIRRLTQQGSAVVLASFLVVSTARAATTKPSARELAKRWRERQPMRLEELRRSLGQDRNASARWLEARQRMLARRGDRAPVLAERFHADGLVVPEPRPLNQLLDPLGFFEDEAGEEPPVAATPRLFLADFDGDGDLDAFVGDKYGYVRYLRNDGGPGNEPVFVELTGAASPTGALDLSFAGDGSPPLFPHGPSAPTLVDIDGDGDLDLFVGQGYDFNYGSGGRVLFFENQGGTFVRNDAENPFAGLLFGDLGATPHFVDIDGDGDFDAFIGTKESAAGDEMFFLQNDGDDETPAFSDQTGTPADPFAGVSFLPSAAPFFADIDGDGDLDAFVGNAFLTRFFRNDTVVPGSPVFTEVTGYGNPLAGGLMAGPAPVLADVDGDGDLDAFVTGGYYGKAGYYVGFVQYFENTGTAEDSSFLSAGDRLELVDVDGDGDLDALVSVLDPSVSPDALPAPRSSLSEKGVPPPPPPPSIPLQVWYFRNLGTTAEPVWELQSGAANPFFTFNTTASFPIVPGPFIPSAAPTVGHLDGNGLLDAFVGLPDGKLEFLEDDGTGQLLPGVAHDLELVDFGLNADPHLADVNGDGELDLVVGHEVDSGDYYSAYVSFFLNPVGPTGLQTTPDFVLDFTGQILRPAPTVADVDGDGDMDLLVGGYYYSEGCECGEYSYGLTLFVENTGTPLAPAFDESSAVPVEALVLGPTSPALGDVNGDGLLDLFLGNSAGAEMFLTAVPALEVTKAITGGNRIAGGTVVYTVTVTNTGAAATVDDPDDPELTDTLPPELTLVSAEVVSGPGSVSTSGNTVRWDGALEPGESVVISIVADIDEGVSGQTIENQAIAAFDTDEDGDNDTEAPSDDPATVPSDDPTAFVAAQSLFEIPTLSQWGTALFAGLLSLLGFLGLRRFNG